MILLSNRTERITIITTDMAKEAYYFSHDSNARNDDKIIALRMRHQAEGYGVYFMILERLRESSDYMSIKDYNMLAFDFRVGADKVKSVVEDFGLFSFTEDGKRFYSESFSGRMKQKDEKSEKARQSASKRWGDKPTQCEGNANASSNECEGNALKEKKGKEKKEISPSIPQGKIEEVSFKLLESLPAPDDGIDRNYEGLIKLLMLYNISVDMAIPIIKHSNYGEVSQYPAPPPTFWKAIVEIQKGGIHSPGEFILSKFRKSNQK